MYERLLEVLDRFTSAGRAYAELLTRWNIDRKFTFPGMIESCRHTVSTMEEYGFSEARVEEFPADGRTVYGTWKMPLAWEATSATLEVVEPAGERGRVLCDYAALPCGLTMWSAPTPPEGVVAEVVVVPTVGGRADFSGLDVSNRIVFTNLRGIAVRNEAVRRGAAGILSDACRHPFQMPDAVDWMNAWCDDPSGWGLTTAEDNAWGFNISHRQGQELRRLIESETVRLRAKVSARVYEGTMPVATGIVRGAGKEEVLVLGHGAEQGANDNASGCAVMLEALRALKVATATGLLPLPARSIRALISWEIYGTQAFYARYPELLPRTVAGLCLDMVGEDQVATGSYTLLHRDPHAMLSFADSLSRALAREWWGKHHPRFAWSTAEFSMTDNITADPLMGVPTPYVGATAATDRYWHTSEDTPDKVSPENLKMMATYAATYLYILASAGTEECVSLAELISADAEGEVREKIAAAVTAMAYSDDETTLRDTAAAAARHARYLGEVHSRSFTTLDRLVRGEDRSVLSNLVDAHRSSLERTVEEGVAKLQLAFDAVSGVKKRRASIEEPHPITPEDKEAAGLVVTRCFSGALSFDTIPLSDRAGVPSGRFGGPLYTLLSWCDGSRTLAEAARLAGGECGTVLGGYLEQVRKLEQFGFVSITHSGETN